MSVDFHLLHFCFINSILICA